MKNRLTGNSKHTKKRVRDKTGKIELIYQVFFDLVREKGYANVSTNHVAERANISVGTIYRYFPKGKMTIIKKYFETVQEDVFRVEDLPAKELRDTETFFRKYITRFVQVHRENLAVHQAYEQAMLENPEVLAGYARKVRKFIEELATRFSQLDQNYARIPPEFLQDRLLRVFNIFEALTRQHLVIMPLFPTDEEFVEFLLGLMDFFSKQMG